MNATEKRAAIIAAYKTILDRNIYSQDSTKRECCFTPYKDGKYYSDCSSSIRLAYKKANVGFSNIGGNTVGMYQHKGGVKVDCAIRNGVPTDVSKLRVGDILLFAGNDPGRAYADFVGHVEMVHAISGNTVTLCGHGSGKPSTKEMVAYCKNRQATAAITKRGNRGLLKIVRFISDDEQDITPTTPPVELPNPSGRVCVIANNVNIRKGPGITFAVAATAKKGDSFEAANTDGWVPIIKDGVVLWMFKQYTEVR